MKDFNELAVRMEKQNVWDWVLWREATAAIRDLLKQYNTVVTDRNMACDDYDALKGELDTLRAELFLAKSEAMALEKDLEMVQTENDELTKSLKIWKG